MTPERALFHLRLLDNGERALLDEEVNAALEADAPAGGLILDLAVCVRDDELRRVLTAYLLDHPPAMEKAEALLRAEIAARFEQGRLTQAEAFAMMRTAGADMFLAWEAAYAEEYAEMAAEGYISEEAAVLYTEALLRGEPRPDVWQLDKAIRRAKERGEP